MSLYFRISLIFIRLLDGDCLSFDGDVGEAERVVGAGGAFGGFEVEGDGVLSGVGPDHCQGGGVAVALIRLLSSSPQALPSSWVGCSQSAGPVLVPPGPPVALTSPTRYLPRRVTS